MDPNHKNDVKSTQAEAFPRYEDETSGQSHNNEASSSAIVNRIRGASNKFQESSLPLGAWQAAGQTVSAAPSVTDIRQGSFDEEGWTAQGQLDERHRRSSIRSSQERRRRSNSNRLSGAGAATSHLKAPALETVQSLQMIKTPTTTHASDNSSSIQDKRVISEESKNAKINVEARTTPFSNGYEFPPKYTWQQSTVIALKAFWKFTCTPFGFLVVIYGLNVVGWGAMIFFLLLNAAPAMCLKDVPDGCNDINSPRRIWVEITAQILTALFCVTGLGLIPWRFRDLYYIMKYRVKGDVLSLRRLGGINRTWLRLPGSHELPVELGPDTIQEEFPEHVESKQVAFPLRTTPDAPLTGIRAPDTSLWKLDLVIWLYVWNTILQCVLNGIMWGLNRYNRPSWATGLFVALACIVAGWAGILTFIESKRVKAIEGVPVTPEEHEKLKRDRELGVVHYNNISGKAPKEKK